MKELPVRQAAVPAPDPDRVRAIAARLTDIDAVGVAAFGERARGEVIGSVDRLLAEMRSNDLKEAEDALGVVLGEIDDLDPRALEPRRGLGGLFDSRGRRLKRFRDRFARVVALTEGLSAEMGERGRSLGARGQALETFHGQARAFILELDAYVAAGRQGLADPVVQSLAQPPSTVGEGEAASLGTSAGQGPETSALKIAMPARLAVLGRVRDAALTQLALVRVAQNADVAVQDRLTAVTRGLDDWRQAWRERLGLSGRRPRRVRADTAAMEADRQTLRQLLTATRAELARARARRAEAASRMEAAAQAARLTA